MPWDAHLQLDYTVEASRTVARHQHTGPLRILQSLYPEGDGICHNVLVHPPGGLVGGDTLDIHITARGGAHGLVTTPGATRFYKSDGELALQRTNIALQGDARLEWLPMEAICYNRCLAENHLRLTLADAAEFIGWDVTALGLPQANLPFERGNYAQTNLDGLAPGAMGQDCGTAAHLGDLKSIRWVARLYLQLKLLATLMSPEPLYSWFCWRSCDRP